MYDDIPTVTQWKNDTTENGQRNDELLLPFDNALKEYSLAFEQYTLAKKKLEEQKEGVLDFKANFPGMKDMGWNLAFMRYYEMTFLEFVKPVSKQLRLCISNLYDIATKKLLSYYNVSINLLNERISFDLSTGTQEHALKADYISISQDNKGSQEKDPPLFVSKVKYADPKKLWIYEVRCESGTLSQIPWWEDNFKPETKDVATKPVCTITRRKFVTKTISCIRKEAHSNELMGILNYKERLNLDGSGEFPVTIAVKSGTFTEYTEEDIYPNGNKSTTIGLAGDVKYDVHLRCYYDEQGKPFNRTGSNYDSSSDFVPYERDYELPQYLVPEESSIRHNDDQGQFKGLKYVIIDIDNDDFEPYLFRTKIVMESFSLNWESKYGRETGIDWGGYVLGSDGKLYMAEHNKDNLFHSFYFSGKPILCGGGLMVDGAGSLWAFSNLSGHYQPPKSSLLHVLYFFNKNKIDLSNVVVVLWTNLGLQHYWAADILKKGNFPEKALSPEEISAGLKARKIYVPGLGKAVCFSDLPSSSLADFVGSIVNLRPYGF